MLHSTIKGRSKGSAAQYIRLKKCSQSVHH